jgi:hypothetical protein
VAVITGEAQEFQLLLTEEAEEYAGLDDNDASGCETSLLVV